MDSTQSKICTTCERERPLAEFGPDQRCKDGRRGQCKRCHQTGRQASRRRHPETWAATQKRYSRRTGSLPIQETPPPYLRQRWTPDEDALVLAGGMTDREMADVLHRSAKAICLRRLKLRRIG